MGIIKIFCITTAFFLLIGTHLTYAAEEDSNRIVFKWAFFLSKEGQKEEVIDVKKTTSVTSNDMLQIYFERGNEVYIYIFLFDTSKNLNMLYPLNPDYYSNNHPVPGEIYLPDIDRHFQFDENTGVEKFFLLASASRLEKLESLMTDYIQEKKGKGESKAKVLDTIKQIRREHAQMTSLVEKGVPIAGTVKHRMLTPPDKAGATLVEAEQFYSKTIRLKHE